MPDGSALPARFHVTPGALAQVAAIAARAGRPGAGLRVSVDAGGCSGFSYRFEIEDTARPDDYVVEGPVPVFVDGISLELVEGARLDWKDELIGAHFSVTNPQAASGCGCGVSFSVA